jgi:hypothetical protein
VTYGEGPVNETMEAQPDALIWDTDKRGKRPDVLRFAHAAYRDSGAEPVVYIANKTITGRVVNGMERRDVPVIDAPSGCGQSAHER